MLVLVELGKDHIGMRFGTVKYSVLVLTRGDDFEMGCSGNCCYYQ